MSQSLFTNEHYIMPSSQLSRPQFSYSRKTLMSSSAPPPIDVLELFPSLLLALNRLQGAPLDAGWFLGILADVAYCFISPIVLGASEESLEALKQSGLDYLRANACYDEDTPFGAVSLLILDELVTFLQGIHTRLNEVREDGNNSPDLPWVVVLERDATHSSLQFEPDDSATEFHPIGRPIPLSHFSSPYPRQTPPTDPCPICHIDLTKCRVEELVVANCTAGHVFHGECLGGWINDSAMLNANTCPLDREEICEGRERVHGGGEGEEREVVTAEEEGGDFGEGGSVLDDARSDMPL
ncbi:hypothetical protein P154DRAFT_567026 [Amniculicola lignicola CBS 123094]|uniref:RING-type domain-containing protein n=1 Tax=Amniculicola lignicola CBS 123094 TaxID=1392246 RepID=A0A6A5W0V5_9PLEO|nr:hypothetical protein P154DRAFT_567026 [Amniculicola lignicola CBS 123094]